VAGGLDCWIGELDALVWNSLIVEGISNSPAGWRPRLRPAEVVEADEGFWGGHLERWGHKL